MSFDAADETIARINAQVQQAQERAVQAAAVRREVDSLRASVSSDQGDIEVQVDVVGRLSDLTLTRSALDRHPDALAREILRVAREAQVRAGEKALTLAADAFGAESDLVERMRLEIGERVGPEVPKADGSTGLARS